MPHAPTPNAVKQQQQLAWCVATVGVCPRPLCYEAPAMSMTARSNSCRWEALLVVLDSRPFPDLRQVVADAADDRIYVFAEWVSTLGIVVRVWEWGSGRAGTSSWNHPSREVHVLVLKILLGIVGGGLLALHMCVCGGGGGGGGGGGQFCIPGPHPCIALTARPYCNIPTTPACLLFIIRHTWAQAPALCHFSHTTGPVFLRTQEQGCVDP